MYHSWVIKTNLNESSLHVVLNNLPSGKYILPRSRSPLPKFLYTAYNSMYKIPRTTRDKPPTNILKESNHYKINYIGYLGDGENTVPY